jgi:protein TonB
MNANAKSAALAMPTEPYGRIELRKSWYKNFARGLAISIAIHLLVVSSYYMTELFGEEEQVPTVSVRILKYSDLGPPPSISNIPPPPSFAVVAASKPSIGVPVPVPDAEVSPEQTLATQQELSRAPSPALEQEGQPGGQIQIAQDVMVGDNEPGMDEFIPVEKPPQVVQKAIPKYPEMASRAGLEGTVWVKILVDKDGRPKKAVVVKSTTEIFNEAAVEAAMQFVFTPAYMNNGPVKVWVAIPFKFKLKEITPS